MDAKTPKTETAQEREQLLAALTPRGRRLIEDLMDDYPDLTAAEAIEHCRAMGGL